MFDLALWIGLAAYSAAKEHLAERQRLLSQHEDACSECLSDQRCLDGRSYLWPWCENGRLLVEEVDRAEAQWQRCVELSEWFEAAMAQHEAA